VTDPLLIIADKAVEVFRILLSLSVGFGFRELVATFAFDWSILSGKRALRWPQLLYFAAKIGWILCVTSTGTLAFAEKRQNCSRLALLDEASNFLLTFSSSGLLACRAYAVYDNRRHRRIAGIILTLCGIAMAGVWIAGMGSVRLMWVKGGPEIRGRKDAAFSQRLVSACTGGSSRRSDTT